MLKLTRNEGQVIMVGDDIMIRIDKLSEHQVTVAIEAPRNIPVHRLEIYEQIKAGIRKKPKGGNR